MAHYVVLINFTEQGVKTIKDVSKRQAAARQAFEKAGGKLDQVYLTMGSYDAVAIVEAPNDEAAAAVLLSLGGLGNVRTTTLRAFTEAETAKLVGNIR